MSDAPDFVKEAREWLGRYGLSTSVASMSRVYALAAELSRMFDLGVAQERERILALNIDWSRPFTRRAAIRQFGDSNV